ncbi:MAG TPA: prolipoprotein diacylglyceryl transferase [Candidatus Avilachnospira avicola]|nr:prolipoprotein diacylglyceryl transferase [Candidatus Avilachnospira avicola]
MSYNGADLIFPHLGIIIQNMSRSIQLPGGFTVYYYGIIIAIGMLCGICVAVWDAKRRGQDPDLYTDFAVYAIIISVIGARLYYVIFDWDLYKNDLLSIFNLRKGGLAIYGGIIAAFATAYVYTKARKFPFLRLADTGILGLITGQIIGRWGNFFNCEAFGGYTDGLFAMRIRESLVNPSMISEELREHLIYDAGVSYIQVHPTFLYESVWNLLSLCFLIWFGKYRQKWQGEITVLYLLLYGLGRFMIEGLRTDQLLIPGTELAVSQCLSALLFVGALCILIIQHKRYKGMPVTGLKTGLTKKK